MNFAAALVLWTQRQCLRQLVCVGQDATLQVRYLELLATDLTLQILQQTPQPEYDKLDTKPLFRCFQLQIRSYKDLKQINC